MSVTIWSSSYSKPHVSQTVDGGFISVATLKASSPSQIWFKRAADGSTWAAAVLVGTTSNACQVWQTPRSGRFIVTDGLSAMWYSDDYGKTWSAF